VGKAVQALHALNPAIITVHAAGGRAMMEDAKAAAPKDTKVVAVTVLTSLDADDLDPSASPPMRMSRCSG
jgi:orotidine-5'-phosphate decarboxylase